jgi:hypothetical protein
LTSGIENPVKRHLILDPADQHFEHFLRKNFDTLTWINIASEPLQPPIQQ